MPDMVVRREVAMTVVIKGDMTEAMIEIIGRENIAMTTGIGMIITAAEMTGVVMNIITEIVIDINVIVIGDDSVKEYLRKLLERIKELPMGYPMIN